MGHFFPLNPTSVAIFSPASSNKNGLMWLPVKASVRGGGGLTVRVKGASSFSYKVVASGPCSIQGVSAG